MGEKVDSEKSVHDDVAKGFGIWLGWDALTQVHFKFPPSLIVHPIII